MRKILIITLILFIPILYAQDCNTKCLEAGYSSGMCVSSCGEIEVDGANDCQESGVAFLAIGSEAVSVYEDKDPFIGENKTDPNWVWIIKNIKTNTRTNILDTDDDTKHTGPILGIKNDFIATDIDTIDVKAVTVGGSFCFPNNVVCIKLNKLTVSNYGTYIIQKTTVDLSAFNSSWTNKATMLIQSVDDGSGLTMQTSGYDSANSGADGATTDKIWIIYNDTGSDAAVYYEDSSNAKALAGYINMNDPNDDINIADVSYKKTLGTNIQIDLRGNFSAQNNLDLVLDILGEEGDANTDGSDDITISLKHDSNSDFDGLGNTSATEEDEELVWVSTNIGKKDENHRSLYGIIIKNPKTNSASDKVELEIPEDQVKAEVEIIRKKSSITETKITQTTVLGEQIPSPVLSSELKNKEDFNLILIGGPCINPPLEVFEEFPTCADWPLKRGEAMIKFAKNKDNIALLIAGTTAKDTKMATEFLKDYKGDLEGTYIIIRNNIPQVIDPSSGGVDISDYPFPFIKTGKFQNMMLVVGDNAKASDTIGAQDIASSLLSITRRATEFTNITIETNTSINKIKEITLGNSLGDSNFFSTSLGKSDIKTLIDGKLSYKGNEIAYEEKIMLYGNGPTIATSLSSSDDAYKENVYMEATVGSMRFYYVFDNSVDISLVTEDEPLTVNLLDNSLSLTEAVTATKFKSQSAIEYYLKTGEKVTVEGKEVQLVDVDTNQAIVIKTNNTEEIISLGKVNHLNGLNIKNVEAFDIEGTNCCCTDLLSGLI